MPLANKPARRRAAGLIAGLALMLSLPCAAQQVRMLVQSSPLAGYSYHSAKTHWAEFATGDALALVREPDNPHDTNAVAVFWRSHKLGYVPRTQNSALAWAMDRGEQLSARISALRAERNPRKRVEFEVFVE
jgi:hypothetical protein